MEDIKVGEYIRTKKGIIGKVYVIDSIFAYLDREVKYIEETESSIDYVFKTDITKHSFDIIDLIECGDILEVEVSGFIHKYEVYASTYNSRAIHDVNDGTQDLETYIEDYCNGKFNIVTHESFNSIKYEVK